MRLVRRRVGAYFRGARKMSRLRIERMPIQNFNLGLLGFDHLQLVFQPSVVSTGLDQSSWLVIEGTFLPPGARAPYTSLSVLGGDGVTTLAEANPVDLGTGGVRLPTPAELQADIGTPYDRGSTVLPVIDPFSAFQTMASLSEDIDNQVLPYLPSGVPFTAVPTINSTSVIATLLHNIGLDISVNWPAGMRFSPGAKTLIGSTGDDDIELNDYFVNLVGGRGRDLLSGTDDESKTESFYGGLGDDGFRWSGGNNTYHGGQTELTYGADGDDTIIYDGVGEISIFMGEDPIPHVTPELVVEFDSGRDWLLSVERIEFDQESDVVNLGEGVALLPDGLTFEFGSQDVSGQGDRLDLSLATEGLIFNSGAADTFYVTSQDEDVEAGGIWVEGAEWLVGTQGDDRIFVSDAMRGADGGDGDDMLDARLSTAGSADSPDGYDIELMGGSGDDTLVSGAGRVFADGGDGADDYVLSHLTGHEGTQGTVEFVIGTSDANDQLFVPYNYFNNSQLGFDNSLLMPVLGAIGSFSQLQNGETLSFEYLTINDYFHLTETFTQDDFTQGVISFTGGIEYVLDGTDLVISFFEGIASTETFTNVITGETDTATFNRVQDDTETIVRVEDFSEGDLGIQFYDPGPGSLDVTLPDGGMQTIFFGMDPGVIAITNNGVFAPALELRPEAPQVNPNAPDNDAPPEEIDGTDQPDIIVSSSIGDTTINGMAGDDTLTGNDGDDTLDGGAGDDQLQGEAGNDTYIVDSLNDTVIEQAGAGIDTVISSVDFTLGDNLENLTLTGAALDGVGNARANTVRGNQEGNLLDGGDGRDTLFGGGGDDILVGGTGSDSYVYFYGDGNDTIVDTSGADDVDTLVLTGGFTPDDLVFYRASLASNDLLINVSSGGRIVVQDFYSSARSGIDQLRFDSGLVWDRAQIDAAAAAATITANDLPQAVADTNFYLRGNSNVIPADVLLANDQDFNGDVLTIVSVGAANVGTATLLATGDIELVTPDGFNGIVSFAYTISDGVSGTSSANVNIAVEPANFDPNATNDSGFQIAVGSTQLISQGELLANDFDTDADPLSVVSVQNALNGTAMFDAQTGTIILSASAGATGVLSFDYTVDDGAGGTATASVYVDITTSTNTPPSAVDDIGFMVNAGESLTVTSAELLDNDFDDDGDPISIVSVQNVLNGTATFDPVTGEIVVATSDGSTGSVTFDYTISDPDGGTSSASVTIGIVGGGGPNVIDGSDQDDVLTGTTGDDIISGFDGEDTLSGLAGNDQIFGGRGADTIDGGGGDDMITGNRGGDSLSGGDGDDLVLGRRGSDEIYGGSGNDELRGGRNDDVIDGGLGDDFIVGGRGSDVLVGGEGNDTLRGRRGSDSLDGGVGDDVLKGGRGGDTIDGGEGHDVLRGGVGSDTFVFVGAFGNDTVIDFDIGTDVEPFSDTIDLSGFGFTDVSQVLAQSIQDGNDTLITIEPQSSVRLMNVDLAMLQADDFIL